jgi:hypothetical protein
VKRPSVPWLVLGILLFAAIVVLVGTYAFLPSLLEGAVARTVQDQLGLAQAPEVELEAGSPPEMLAGRFSGGEISLRGANLEEVRAEQITLDLDPFDLDVLRSLGAPRTEGPLSGTLRATVPEGEVLRVVRAEFPVRDLRLEEGRMVVDSEAAMLGLTVPVSVGGDLVLRGRELVFEPQEVSVRGSEVRPEVAQAMLGRTDLAFPLEALPLGAEVQGVEVQENRLVVTARMERIPLGAG